MRVRANTSKTASQRVFIRLDLGHRPLRVLRIDQVLAAMPAFDETAIEPLR